MFFKNPFRKPYFTKEFYIVLIIAILVLLFSVIILRQSYALKTEQIELRESGGSYDGNLLLTRDSSGYLVITTPAGTAKIKDGQIILTGNIIVDGAYIGLTDSPNLLFLETTGITIDPGLWAKGEALFGDAGQAGIIRILNNPGAYSITLQGSTGNATFTGGLNVGTSTGAAVGEGRFSGTIRHSDSSDYIIYTTHRTAVTSDASWHDMGTYFALNPGESLLLIADITAIEELGANAAGYTVTALMKRTFPSGYGSLVGVTKTVNLETNSSWDADIYNPSSWQLYIRVKGGPDPVRWAAHVKAIRAYPSF